MRRSRPSLRRSAPLLLAALLASAVLVAAGCESTTTAREGADVARGQELFVQKCGGCHVLGDAGTLGQTGPNLDDGFGPSREQGFDESTFFEVVLHQMKIPGPPMPEFDNPDDEANFLEDDDLVNVAAYVASVAGRGEAAAEPTDDDPQQLFVSACGSCHTLSDAGTTGATAPNLDETTMTVDQAIEQIRTGGGGMPPFEGTLTAEQIRALAEYVVGGSR